MQHFVAGQQGTKPYPAEHGVPLEESIPLNVRQAKLQRRDPPTLDVSMERREIVSVFDITVKTYEPSNHQNL